jgi:ATP synthase F0 subunit c
MAMDTARNIIKNNLVEYPYNTTIEEFREMNDPVAFVAGLKLLGAGLAMLGAIGAGVGVGIAASGGVQAMGRNPDAANIIQTNMILGMAFAEAVAIYALAVALIIIFAA